MRLRDLLLIPFVFVAGSFLALVLTVQDLVRGRRLLPPPLE